MYLISTQKEQINGIKICKGQKILIPKGTLVHRGDKNMCQPECILTKTRKDYEGEVFALMKNEGLMAELFAHKGWENEIMVQYVQGNSTWITTVRLRDIKVI